MSPQTDIKQKWAVASYALQDANTDFILSRQAMLCSRKTVRFYHFTAGEVWDHIVEICSDCGSFRSTVAGCDRILHEHPKCHIGALQKF